MDGLLRGVAPPAGTSRSARRLRRATRRACPRGSCLTVVVERHTAPAGRQRARPTAARSRIRCPRPKWARRRVSLWSLALVLGAVRRRCARTRPARRGPACPRDRAPSSGNNLGPFCFEVLSTFGDAGCCWRSTVGDAVCWRGGTASSTKGAKGAGMGGLARASLEVHRLPEP